MNEVNSMKYLLGFGLSALTCLTLLGTSSIAAPTPMRVDRPGDGMTFAFNAPFISSSGLLGEHHIIRVMVLGMSLENVMVSIPPQMVKFNKITVTDESGKVIPAKIERMQGKVSVMFEQPVSVGKTIELDFSDLDLSAEKGNILLYGVTAKQTNLSAEIPIGTARIQVPDL
jgi:hypothetical protein